MANQISLFLDWVFGMTDYIERHAANYALIESALNQILGQLTGQSGGISVPYGLQEIFDRKGLIGRDSYDFEEGTLTGPDYHFQVGPGAYWSNGTFYRKNTAFTLTMAGKESGTFYINLDAAGNPLVSSAADATTRQFAWDAGTHTIADKAVFAGVAILFDGDDYADMLDSAVKGKTFTRVADRLEELEQGGDIFGGNYAQDLPHGGLSFKFKAGKVRNDSVITDTPAGQVALTNGATNYVEVDPATGVVSANQTGFNSGKIPLYQVITAAGAITAVNDKRTPAVAGTGGGGGGGGHTQGTDTGTTVPTFIIDSDAAGNPTGRAGLEVENGDDPNAALKFNRDTGHWEYTADGGASWKELGDADFDLGAQELTKYVPQDDPPLVLETLGRGSSVDYEDLDLSPHISALLGAAAAVLRVQFWDAAPGEGIKVLFKKRGSPANPVTAYTVWSGVNDPGTIAVPLDSSLACQYFVFASGVDTANIRIFLQGYMEKVTGVGTQEKAFTQDNISCPANSQVDLTFENFMNRSLVHYFKIEETSGLPTNVFDVHLYADSGFSTLLYKVENIGPGTPFEDWLPFWVYDAGRERKLRLRLVNHDASHAGTFSVTITAEQLA